MGLGPIGDIAGMALTAVNPAAGAAVEGFSKALDIAGGKSGDDQLIDGMVTGGVQLMGQMMMRSAGDMLNEAMEDDEG